MPLTVHKITRYNVQVLTRKVGEEAHSMITVRLYDEDNIDRGVIVFERHGDGEPPKPTGDYQAKTAKVYLDIAHYPAYIEILRLEKTIYFKIGWTQQGRSRTVSHVSIDTKKEVVGEFFKIPPGFKAG
jgi:hypothetical protein